MGKSAQINCSLELTSGMIETYQSTSCLHCQKFVLLTETLISDRNCDDRIIKMPLSKEAAQPTSQNHPVTSCRFNWIPDEIFKLPYFHQELINSDTAISYIKKNSRQPGSFLLRTSSKGKNHLSLSVSVADGQVHHIQVYVTERNTGYNYYIVPDIVFQSFSSLQQHYSKHRIGNLEGVDNVKLIFPLARRSRTQSLPNIEKPEIAYSSNRAVELSRRTSDISASKRPGTNLTSNNHGSNTSLTDPRHRPPQPLPHRPPPGAEGSTPYYTRPTDEEIDRAGELAELLRNNERCDCGLLLHEAELGSSWTVHKSRDASTIGKIFYQHVNGDTSWNLAESVLMKLNPQKMNYLVNLYREGNQRVPFDPQVVGRLNSAFMF